MNNRLKFRVWDKMRKTYIYPNKGYQGHYTLSLNGTFYNLQNGSGDDEYIVQQYTGINTRDGKEIYEGDIIEYTVDGHKQMGTVAFLSGMFVCEWDDQTEDELGYMLLDGINVIRSKIENENEWKCPHCSSDKGTWFSRIVPMGNFCIACGKAIDANHDEPVDDPEYRIVEVDGFDLNARQIIIKYDKKEPMPMVSVGDKMLVAWKHDVKEI